MKFKDLKKYNQTELARMLAEEKDNLQALRFKIKAAQHKRMTDVKAKTKLIARIQTLLNNPVEKETEASKEEPMAKETK